MLVKNNVQDSPDCMVKMMKELVRIQVASSHDMLIGRFQLCKHDVLEPSTSRCPATLEQLITVIALQ